MNKQTTFFAINVKLITISGEFWVPYGGPNLWQFDWWNISQAKFSSEESAMNEIKTDDHFKSCDWQIVKTVVTDSIVKESSR